MALLDVLHITKIFSGNPALEDVSLSVDRQQVLCLLGPSGCGKTTLLRIIAGLEKPDKGKIIFNGTDMSGIPPYRRNFGMMFQDFALFPHKNVFENVAFGLRMKKLSPEAVTRRAHSILKMVGLENFADRDVQGLSGGERQRVALARSLTPRPRLLMLDEPLGSLDRSLREHLAAELRHILRRTGVTSIFVTHDQAEAFAVADKIAVLHRGRIEQTDSPENVYRYPANPTVAGFLGFHNIIEGKIEKYDTVKTSIGTLYPATNGFSRGETVAVLLRPESAEPVIGGASCLPRKKTLIQGTVTHRLFQGKYYQLGVKVKTGQDLSFEIPTAAPPPKAGQAIQLFVDPSAVVIMKNLEAVRE